MPKKTYVDNAMNRSLGRVGMPHGSCVHSSTSSSSSSSGYAASAAGYYKDTSLSTGSYVDNAKNRSLGRVGKPLGSHVEHSDGSVTVSGGAGYSAWDSLSSYSSSQRSYVDNAKNRSLGRVGKPVGSHVLHRDGSVSVSSDTCASSSREFYVDNTKNRDLGRVGKPVGSHVLHKDGSVTVSSGGTPTGSSSSLKCYVDNPKNRDLGRVGKPVGSHVLHKDGSVTVSSTSGAYASSTQHKDSTPVTLQVKGPSSPSRCYADNAFNRNLGRVGKQIVYHRKRRMSMDSEMYRQQRKEQELLYESSLDKIADILRNKLNFTDREYPAFQYAQCELRRHEIEEGWKKSGISPYTDQSKTAELTKEIIPLREIELLRKIGEGGFGKVYAGLWKKLIPVAFKKLACQQITKKKQEQLVKEIKIFSSLDHPNIVKMFGVVVEKDNIGIVMEYLPKTLFHAIFIEEVIFTNEQKKKIISEIISALDYLHTPQDGSPPKPKIAHCDVKSQNILLDKSHTAKLCDFGLSAIKNTMQSSSSRSLAVPGQGTPRYAAPEVLRGEVLSMSGLTMSDIYSLSLVVFEILVEEEPYEDLGMLQLIENVGRGSLRPAMEASSLSSEVKQLLMRGWDGEASRRPTVKKFAEEFSKIDLLHE